MSLLSRLAIQASRAYGFLSSKNTNVSADYLVVAGGGGGGFDEAGGGGAGGYQTSTFTLSTLNTYSITVGAGGNKASVTATKGANGSNSVISGTGITTVTSTGGGGGGSEGSTTGASGGSGGGGRSRNSAAGGSGTVGQGNNGGNGASGASDRGGGGGGGASAVGGTGSGNTGAAGGAGSSSSISGSSVTYAGGGGGGGNSTGGAGGSGGGGAGAGPSNPVDGTANTGGGGGGGDGGTGALQQGANGGSGIVIISYTATAPKFVGGTITTSGGKQIHTFTASGSLTPATAVTASYLVVAGGGGGAGHSGASRGGGGGGGGGYLESTTTLYYPATYTVTVGAGGTGAGDDTATNGSNSVISGTGITTITSTGGGAGRLLANGVSGGSGGGGGYTTNTGGTGTSGQGNNGGNGGTATGSASDSGGGGGGAGGVGGNGSSAGAGSGGTGGSGTASSISGTSVSRAGGGGGGNGNGNGGTATAGGGTGGGTGAAGTANTGGGGGGKGLGTGGSGGSGVVIISYSGTQKFNGGIITTSGGNTIHTFYATGALTPLTNNLTNSLRFRSSASAYLSRTPTVAGNRQTWTISFWWKRGTLSSEQYLVSADTSAANETWLRVNAADTLQFQTLGGTNANLSTSAVFRDPSAWYHIVMSYDSTQATAGNRFKLYVNGNQQTLTGTNPTLNESQAINNTVSQQFCRRASTSSSYADNYLTDIYLIDGQALEPYYFGSNDSNNIWKPIKYYGTYGTNGFYLPFNNTTSTTTLGYDSSPNGNNWTCNNISLTAGSTYDSMTDVPTLTSATAANYCTLNPLNASMTPTAANLNLEPSGTGGNYPAASTVGVSSGKWYFEVVATNYTGSGTAGEFGFRLASASAATVGTAVGDANGFAFGMSLSSTWYSQKYGAATSSLTGLTSATTGTIGMIAVDFDAGYAWVGKDGTWYNSGNPATGANPTITGITAGTYVATIAAYRDATRNYSYATNFGQRAFAYTPPTGYVALNTFNLPTPTILKGNTVMDATLYTGTDGVAGSVVNSAGFKPDLVWIKARGVARDNRLTDSVRGTGFNLSSNSTAAEVSSSIYVTSFNTNGFSYGTASDVSQGTMVGWQWQAGQGTTSSNTNGTITSTVSVNASAGFSVVTYTGTGANATVGHGLGVAPKMVIVKNRSSALDWLVGHTSLTSWAYNLYLNLTSGQSNNPTAWNSTAPTSSVFSVGTWNAANGSTNSMVAYCWAEIAGFSRFGAYTGNGSADGTFVFTGFRPKFVLMKLTSSSSDWWIHDTTRDPSNQSNSTLYPNGSFVEDTSGLPMDILSNGFKLRTSNTFFNGSGSTYIYAAFAENPFKNANAR